MAAKKVIRSTTLQMEIEGGKDSRGNTTYKKKSFTSIRVDAEAQAIYDVAQAIKECLGVASRDLFIADNYRLEDDGNNSKEPEPAA